MKKGLQPLDNLNYPIERKCICCGKKITILDSIGQNSKPKLCMWDDGMVAKIDAGYGSRNDGDMFYIAICDDCTKEKVKDKSLEYIGSYMYPECSKYSENESDRKEYKRQLKRYTGDE